MSITNLDPPPIRTTDHNDRVWVRWFSSVQQKILELKNSTNNLVNKTVITVSSTTEILTITGLAVKLEAVTADAICNLPKGTTDLIGSSISFTLVNDAFNGVINAYSGDNILGDTSKTILYYGSTMDLMLIDVNTWVIV